MAKHLIYQYYDKPVSLDNPQTYWDKSCKSLKKYSEIVEADYFLYKGGAPFCPHFGLFLPFLDGKASYYDSVLYVDCDVLATDTEHTLNIFEENFSDIAAWHMNTGPMAPGIQHVVQNQFPWYKEGAVNTGVVLVPSSEYHALKNYIESDGGLEKMWAKNKYNPKSSCYKQKQNTYGGGDQQVLNQYSIDRGKKFSSLPYNYNYHMLRLKKENNLFATLIHYHRSSGNDKLMHEDFIKEFIAK